MKPQGRGDAETMKVKAHTLSVLQLSANVLSLRLRASTVNC
jgi:hypothetical protein